MGVGRALQDSDIQAGTLGAMCIADLYGSAYPWNAGACLIQS